MRLTITYTLVVLATVQSAIAAATVCCINLPGGSHDACDSGLSARRARLPFEPSVEEPGPLICCCMAGSVAACDTDCFVSLHYILRPSDAKQLVDGGDKAV